MELNMESLVLGNSSHQLGYHKSHCLVLDNSSFQMGCHRHQRALDMYRASQENSIRWMAMDSNMLGASYMLRLATYSCSRECSKEMYKYRLAYSRKVSSNLVLDNLELHKVCNSLGLYNLSLQEECSIEE